MGLLMTSNTTPATSIRVRFREYTLARALPTRPSAEPAWRVGAFWDGLARPETLMDHAAWLLGVTAPAEAADDRRWACS
nr:hypothetical protein GCM10010200_050250 [Actinomadura rugatobispora]